MRVGLVGLGRMGFAMSARLRSQGMEVTAWDRAEPARAAAQQAGARVVASARDVAAAADLVISTITEDHGVRQLFFGIDGFLETDVAGKLFIEMSTLQPVTVKEIAAALGPRGASIVDCPVLGSVPTVHDGKLLGLVGGAPEDVERARVVLTHLTRALVHLGPVGSGCVMKLAVNIGLATFLGALAEGLAMGEQHGLDLDAMLDVFAQAPTANGILNTKMPALRGGPATMTLDIKTLRKDAMSAVATGTTAGVPMNVTHGALATFTAATADGIGDLDMGEIVKFLRMKMVQSFA
jgi:3-hydroxyisobutyrate dehydrogenase